MRRRGRRGSTRPRLVTSGWRCWAELNHLVELALQMNRHLGDARHFDLHGRHLRQPSLMEFAFLLRKGVGGIYHLLPYRRGDDVHTELLGVADVPQGVLLASVRVARDRERDHWRHHAYDGEEGKRREIGNARSTHCRNPAERPRHNGTREKP